jgi:hypothetical protein
MVRYAALKDLSDREDLGDFIWGVAGGYDYVEGRIEPILSEESGGIRPLADLELFPSFARLGAKGEPSKDRILGWIRDHGLLETLKQEERRESTDSERTRPNNEEYFGRFTLDFTNHAPISITEFRKEVLRAHSAAHLHYAFFTGGPEALKKRVEKLRKDRESATHYTMSEIDQWLLDNWSDEQFDIPEYMALGNYWTMDHPTFWAYTRLKNMILDRISDVRLGFADQETPFLGPHEQVKPLQSWECPDLRSAIWLQWYLHMTGASSMKVCANPACCTPFLASRTDRRFCTNTCRSNARHYR